MTKKFNIKDSSNTYHVFIKEHHGGVTEFTGNLGDLIEYAVYLAPNGVFQQVESASEIRNACVDAEDSDSSACRYAHESGKGYVLTTRDHDEPEWSEKHPHADWTESDWVDAALDEFRNDSSSASVTRLPERVQIKFKNPYPEITVPDLYLYGEELANATKSRDRDNVAEYLVEEVIDSNPPDLPSRLSNEPHIEDEIQSDIKDLIREAVEEARDKMLSGDRHGEPKATETASTEPVPC